MGVGAADVVDRGAAVGGGGLDIVVDWKEKETSILYNNIMLLFR